MRVDDIISGERNTCFIGHIQNQISGVFSLCLWFPENITSGLLPYCTSSLSCSLRSLLIVSNFVILAFRGSTAFYTSLFTSSDISSWIHSLTAVAILRILSSPMVTWWVINGLFAVGSVRDSERSSWDTGVDVAIIWVPGTDSSLDFWGFSRHPKKIWTYHWDSFYFCFSGHFGSNVNVITQWYKYI